MTCPSLICVLKSNWPRARALQQQQHCQHQPRKAPNAMHCSSVCMQAAHRHVSSEQPTTCMHGRACCASNATSSASPSGPAKQPALQPARSQLYAAPAPTGGRAASPSFTLAWQRHELGFHIRPPAQRRAADPGPGPRKRSGAAPRAAAGRVHAQRVAGRQVVRRHICARAHQGDAAGVTGRASKCAPGGGGGHACWRTAT